MLVGAMIVMNLFIAVLTDNYDSAEQANEDELGKEEEVDQEQAITAAVLLLKHTNPMRKKCLHIARSKWFERGIMCCILINTVIMMMQFAPRTPSPDAYSYPVGELKAEYGFMPTPYFWFLWVMNTILTVIFTVTTAMRVATDFTGRVGALGFDPCGLDPVRAAIGHDIRSRTREEEEHEDQRGRDGVDHEARRHVDVHEVDDDQVGLHDGDSESREQRQPLDLEHRTDEGDRQQDQEVTPDLDVVGIVVFCVSGHY